MRSLAVEAQRDESIRQLAEQIVKGVWPQDYLSEYAAILNWVRRNIRYTRDPRTIEQVQTPRATWQAHAGDCDDMAVLISTLVGVLGGQTRFVAGAFKQGGMEALSHVWCEAYDPATGKWVVLDPVPGRAVGRMLSRTVSRLAAPAV